MAAPFPPCGDEGDGGPEFYLLRPICIAVFKAPTESNLQRFQAALELLETTTQHLAHYVIFPFAVHMKRYATFKDKTKTALVTCMSQVFQKFQVPTWDMFVELFQRLHLVLAMPEDPTQFNPKLPEDQVEALTSCIHVLCERNLGQFGHNLFGEDKSYIAAHSVFLLLKITESQSSKNIKLTALRTMQIFVETCSGKKQAESTTLFQFLPGIVSSLRKMVDVRMGRVQIDLFNVAMKLLQDSIMVSIEYQSDDILTQPDIHLATTLDGIINDIVICGMSSFKRPLVNFIDNVLHATEKKMPRCRACLINNLLVLKTDPDQEVSSAAEVLAAQYQQYIEVSYNDVLEKFHEALSQLQGKDDTTCSATIARLVSCLGSLKLNYFETRELLNLMFDLLLESSALENRVIYDFNVTTTPVFKMCSRLCPVLISAAAKSDVLEICENKFTEFNGDVTDNIPGCVLFLNEIFRWQASSEDHHFLGRECAIQFCELFIQLLDIQSTEVVLSALEEASPKIQSLVDVRKAFLLQGLGLMAKLYPKFIVPMALFHIIEYAGTTDAPIIAVSAKQALEVISEPKDVKEFLTEHSSSVMSDISVRILNLTMYPNSPNALIFLAEYFDFSEMLTKLVDQIITRSCDPFSGSSMQLLYTKVFFAFLTSLWKHKERKVSGTKTGFLSHRKIEDQSIYQFLQEYEESLGLSSKTIDEEPAQDNLDEDPENDPTPEFGKTEEKLPEYLTLTKKICLRALNFLPNPEQIVKLLAMDCLIKGIFILQFEEDTLLPLAHKLWQNLVPRIMEKDYVIVRKSLELLACLCMTCGSFLKKRTLDEIFPTLSKALTNLALESEQIPDKNRTYYTYTQSYKLQLTVLQGMAEICKAIDIQEEELHKVIDGCLLYVKPQQHKNLRDAAIKLIDSLVAEDSSCKNRSVWMKLVFKGLRPVPNDLSQRHPAFTPLPTKLL